MIGVVGSAKNGCDGPIDSGNLEFSSVLFGGTVFGVTVFGAVVGGPGLYAQDSKNSFKCERYDQKPIELL